MKRILVFTLAIGLVAPATGYVYQLQSPTVKNWFTPVAKEAAESAILGSAVGDALGRVTEFIPSTYAIFKRYPQGIRSFNDFHASDWQGVPKELSDKKIAPYTDDTRMSLIALRVLCDSREQNWDLETTMSALAHAYVEDMKDPIWGWAADYRVPGISTKKAVQILSDRIEKGQTASGWWKAGDSESGGCGSVMHAYPFGLVFSDDPEKAELWAAEHSKMTHGHPMAVAACAAMARGVAEAIQVERRIPLLRGSVPCREAWKRRVNMVLDSMIVAAQKFHSGTVKKIKRARLLAQEANEKRRALAKPNIFEFPCTVYEALKNKKFRAFHESVFTEFPGWRGDDAIAATVYIFELCQGDTLGALYTAVHTPGDSDSIAAMVGALVGVFGEELPQELTQRLEGLDDMQQLAQRVAGVQPTEAA